LSKAFKQTSTATSKTAFLTPSSVSQLPKGVSFSCTPSPVGSFLEEDIFHDCAASSDDILTVLHGNPKERLVKNMTCTVLPRNTFCDLFQDQYRMLNEFMMRRH
jgi:hypothetical protein